VNGGDLAGTGLGVVLAGVEADLVTVGVVQLGQDPADAGPVHPGVPLAQQAAAVEPLIAGFWQQGREQSRHANAVFWTRMADDGLLDPGIDLAWVIDTSSILAAAETYLLITRMTGWDLDAYQNWLVTTGMRLIAPPPSSVPPVPPAS